MKNEFVTKADLKESTDGLHRRIDSVETGLHQEIASAKNELRAEINSVENKLRGEIQSVKNDLHEEITSLKNELKGDIECLAVQVVQVSYDLNEFKQETRSQFNTVITSIDGLTGLITNMQTEFSAVHHALLRHENRLDDHETRIVAMEKREK